MAVVFVTMSTIGTGASSAATSDKRGLGSDKSKLTESPAAAFVPGNVVIYRVGDGTQTLVNTGNTVFLDEYTTAGTFVQAIQMPTTTTGANRQLIASGTATSEGLLTRSVNGNYLVLAGYASDLGGAVNLTSSTSASIPRTIARVNALGVADTTTALTDAISGGNPRGVASTNGTDLWLTGTSAGGGIRYTTLGSTTSTQLVATPTNIRGVTITANQLYVSSATGAFQGVSTVGTGIPTTTGQTMSLLPGFPTATGPGPYAFAFLNPTTLYVADDRAAPNGGIQKWTFAAGTWTLVNTFNNGITTGIRGMTMTRNGLGQPVFYGTTTETSANRLVTVTDDGTATPAVTVLATAAANTAFRGVAFAPVVTTAAGVYISGRVTTAEGRGITNALVTINGNSLPGPRSVSTGRGGSYVFDDLEPGETYIVTVRSRRFMFSNPSQVISLNDNVSDADFVADGGGARAVEPARKLPVAFRGTW